MSDPSYASNLFIQLFFISFLFFSFFSFSFFNFFLLGTTTQLVLCEKSCTEVHDL